MAISVPMKANSATTSLDEVASIEFAIGAVSPKASETMFGSSANEVPAKAPAP